MGTTAHARLVGQHAAPHAPLNGRADHRAERGVGAERAAQNHHEHLRYRVDVEHHDDARHQQIADRHHRHHHLRDLGDPAHAAEQHQGHTAADHRSGHPARNRPRFIHRTDNRVGLGAGQEQPARHQRAEGEQHRVPAFTQPALDVVGQAAAEHAIAVALLVDLRQGGLDKRAGRAEEGHQPHPEDRTRPTVGNGHGHTGDVAYADPAGQRHA